MGGGPGRLSFGPVILTHTWGWEPNLVPPSALRAENLFSALRAERGTKGGDRGVKGRAKGEGGKKVKAWNFDF